MRRIGTLCAAAALVFAATAVNPGSAAALGLGPWQQYNSHWYAQVDDLSWVDAEAYAVRHGGHLVTINDQDEQNWLATTFTIPNLSIGFNDMAEEGTWVWTSGETVPWHIGDLEPYTNWNPGEPNDWDVGEDVAVTNWEGLTSWNDVPDNTKAIIEVPAPFALNDDVADAVDIQDNVYDDAPDMTFASWETDEAIPCDTGQLSGSVWYQWMTPAFSGLNVSIGGDQDRVTAAIYGPFDEIPTSVDGLLDHHRGCVYGVGPDNAWIEGIDRGIWLIQLSAASDWVTAPSIHIERNFGYFWVNQDSITFTSATVDRSGTIMFTGQAVCEFIPWSPDPDNGYPEPRWNQTGDNEGYYSYDLQGWADQSLGRKTLLSGGGGGQIDCTNLDQNGRAQWMLWVRAGNGKFGPNATNFWFDIGANTCTEEQGCFFYGFASWGSYVKVTKAR
jgi:hypothetical protein